MADKDTTPSGVELPMKMPRTGPPPKQAERSCNKDNQPGLGECCCNCTHRLNDYSHPGTDGKPISELRGYVCAPPMLDPHVFSGWSEHGGCEMWSLRAESGDGE